MDKLGRSRSPDPQQETLREDKAQVNKEISEFIRALIALKKGFNGKPVPELGLQKGNIKEPLPDVLNTLNDKLSTEYSGISDALRTIIHEQEQYSKDRQQRKTTSEEGNFVNAFYQDELLIKEASTMLSRLWSYVKTPFQLSDKFRWDRKNMLQAAAQLEYELADIGIALVSSDDNSIPDAVYRAKTLYTLFQHNLVRPTLALLNEAKQAPQLPEKSEDKSEPAIVPPISELNEEYELDSGSKDVLTHISEMSDDVKNNIIPKVQDVVTYLSINKDDIDPTVFVPLKQILIDLESIIPEFFVLIEKREDLEKIKIEYSSIKDKSDLILETAKQFKDLKVQSSSNDTELVALARGGLRRWFGRRRLELFRQQDHKLRLDADKLIDAAESKINELMGLLESKNADINGIGSKIVEFGLVLSDILKLVAKLGDIHNSEVKIEKLRAKNKGEKYTETNVISETDIRSLERNAEKLGELRKIQDN